MRSRVVTPAVARGGNRRYEDGGGCCGRYLPVWATLRVLPPITVGEADHVWSLEEIAALAE